MIRVLVVDDHPSVRAGLQGLLRCEPGIVPVGASDSAETAFVQASERDADVVFADYHLPRSNGLVLAWRLKQLENPPRVVIYSAFAEPELELAAALSGVDAVLDKASPVDAIFGTIRAVAAGRTMIGPIPPRVMRTGASLIDPRDQSIFGLAAAGESPDVIAGVLGMDTDVVKRRLRSMIEWVRPHPRAEHRAAPSDAGGATR